MSPKTFEAVFEAALRRGKRLLVVGPPGAGKTEIKTQVCARLGVEYVGLCYSDPRSPIYRGVPVPKEWERGPRAVFGDRQSARRDFSNVP